MNVIGDPQWQNSLDINIPSFNISAAGKILFKDAQFNIAHGRRYGLVGPNGKGKSTLLKMIASRDLILPPRVDFLYVEQEVQADDTPAVDAVLKADKVRWSLLEEEKALTAAIDTGDEDPKKFTRLQDVLDELNTIGAASAEAKARRILFGLGFDGEMQTKASVNDLHQSVSCTTTTRTYIALSSPADQNVLWWMEDAYFTRASLVY